MNPSNAEESVAAGRGAGNLASHGLGVRHKREGPMASSGWKALYAGAPWFRGPGRYPIPAYSEFVPPPRIGGKPYDGSDPPFFDENAPYGWPVSESDQHIQLGPGLRHVAHCVVRALVDLGHGRPVRGLSRRKLAGN